MKVIIAGSRGISDIKLVARAIVISGIILYITEVVSGEADGIDKLGEQWAEMNMVAVKRFRANWRDISAKTEPVVVATTKSGRKYNAIAGHNRNERMAEYS